MILYSYLNINNPLVMWEVAIGRYESVDNTPGMVSVWLFSHLKTLSKDLFNSKIIIESELETVRSQYFPEKASRIYGLYAFETEDEAKETLKLWDFKNIDENISAIEFTPQKKSKVDSNWITFYGSYNDKDWAKKYWGGVEYNDTPCWEVIIEGSGIILNNNLRLRAYNFIVNSYPFSTSILSFSLCAFWYNWAKYKGVSKVRAFLLEKDGKLTGTFIMEGKLLKNNQEDIIKAINAFKKETGGIPTIIWPKDKDTFAIIPDFKNENFEIILDEVALKVLRNIGIKNN